ncbi:TolC family protein [Telmatobacter sp. DSM 110680]|uniref:TolC family protein n=1 Tax=Telmatobacter sp. DSM 110680 TaxID=3036704 RepID=A0AAU7DK32_9BACT
MKTTHILTAPLCLVLALPVCSGQTAAGTLALGELSALIGNAHAQTAASTPQLTLDEVERIALAENPEIHVAARKVASAEAHVPLAGALDDPQAMYRGWQVPLAKPWDYNAAQNMLMLSQSFPGRGKRGLRTNIAQSDVEMAKDDLEAARLRVRVDVRKAFFDLLRAQDDLLVHDEHVGIAQQAIEAARIKYSVGKIPQVEILKAQVALTRLAEHMIRFDRDAEVARTHLNTLMGRQPETAIEVQGDYALETNLPSLELLVTTAMHTRPDLAEAAAAEERSRKEENMAKKAMVPDFSVSAGYMLIPSGQSPRNNYMVEGSMSLPWLNRKKHESEVNEATAAVSVKTAEISALKNEALSQIEESLADARAAQRLAHVYQKSLKPQAAQTLHAAVVAYENDQTSFLDLLDSQMTVVDVDLATIDATADFNMKMANLELAVGSPIAAQGVTK